jgi:hypothetical protein
MRLLSDIIYLLTNIFIENNTIRKQNYKKLFFNNKY